MFSMIAAIGKNRELGKDGGLCFHLREDTQYFRETTMGRTVLMGRKTWESLPKKLVGRKNVVVSRGEVEGADEVVENLGEYIQKNSDTEEEIFVIGGGMLYWEMMKYAKKLYITEVDAEAEADTFFPEIKDNEWTKKVLREGEENGVKFAFAVYDRK